MTVDEQDIDQTIIRMGVGKDGKRSAVESAIAEQGGCAVEPWALINAQAQLTGGLIEDAG